MWFWWFMMISGLIIPVLAIFAGRMMWKHCPKEINKLIGYRTKRSMKTDATWKFANEYCGKIWWIAGWIMLILSSVPQIPFYQGNPDTIAIVCGIIIAIQIAVLVITIVPTEIALKKLFFDDGTRR